MNSEYNRDGSQGNEARHLSAYAVDTLSKEMQDEAPRHAQQASEVHELIGTILESITDGFFALDHQWQFTYLNAEAERLLQRTRQELLGANLWEAFPEKVESLFYQEYHRAVAEQVKVAFEEFYAPLDTWFEVRACPFQDGLSVYFRDISEQKSLQNTLHLSEQRRLERADQFEAILEGIADDVYIYDEKGLLLYANTHARELLALDKIPNYNTFPLRERVSWLDARDEHGHRLSEEQLPLSRVLNGEVIKGAQVEDLLLLTQDGQKVRVSISGAPMYDHDRKLIGAVLVSRDVTERHKLEQRSNTLEALLAMSETVVQLPGDAHEAEHLTEDTVDAVDTVDPQVAEGMMSRRLVEMLCHILECQRVGIVLIDPETEVLQPVMVVGISPEHERPWRDNLPGALLSNFLGNESYVARLRSGKVLLLDTVQPLFRDQPWYKLVSPIFVRDQFIGILVLGYDNFRHEHTPGETDLVKAITKLGALVIERARAQSERNHAVAELQMANGQLARANKVKSDFISIVSHEFRTALTGIQGFSEMIRDEDFSMMEVKEFAADIYSDAKRLTRLITDMLDLDRMEAGRMQLVVGWLDLNAIIMDVVGRLRPTTSQHLLRLQLANALPLLMGDHDKLTQVVMNLLSNAIKYSPDGGEIRVSSQIEGSVVHVCVQDQGIGIPVDQIDRVFERFARVESGSSYIEGTGLGLPIVRQIVEMHGGQVWVESVLGEGSVFHFTIQFARTSQVAEER